MSNDKITEETRYFISSLDATAPKYLGQVIRAHWGIENNLHWIMHLMKTPKGQEWEIVLPIWQFSDIFH